VRCRGFEEENTYAMKHGAQSERHIVRRATVEKRRVLRQIGLRQDDLDSLGRPLLQNWARSAALHLMDKYAEEHGWLDEHGHDAMLNSEGLALAKLGDYLRRWEEDPFESRSRFVS
jgi:hypothetical protein